MPGYDWNTPTVISFQIQSKFAISTTNQLDIPNYHQSVVCFQYFLNLPRGLEIIPQTHAQRVCFIQTQRAISQKTRLIQSHRNIQQICLFYVCIYKPLSEKKLLCPRNLLTVC